MVLFLKKMFKYFIGIVSIYLFLFFISSYVLNEKYPDFFTAFIKDKYNAINRISSAKKRIVIVGGSNCIYSINSKKIEEVLGVKVINSGFVYNVGYEFQLNFVKKYTRKGDLVLYIPEFNNYSEQGKLGTSFLYRSILFEPKILLIIGKENFLNFLKNGFKYILEPLLSLLKKDYIDWPIKRNSFNFHGDLTYHLGKESKLKEVRAYSRIKEFVVSDSFIENLDETEKILKEKEVGFVVTYPVFSKNHISSDVIKVTDSLSFFNTKFKGSLEKNLFEDYMFYDSPFHALDEARDIYTENLIKILKNAI